MLHQMSLKSCDSHMDQLISTVNKHSLTGLRLAIGSYPTASMHCHYTQLKSVPNVGRTL